MGRPCVSRETTAGLEPGQLVRDSVQLWSSEIRQLDLQEHNQRAPDRYRATDHSVPGRKE